MEGRLAQGMAWSVLDRPPSTATATGRSRGWAQGIVRHHILGATEFRQRPALDGTEPLPAASRPALGRSQHQPVDDGRHARPRPADVDDQAGLPPVREGREHGGRGDEDGGGVELLEQQLQHLRSLPQAKPLVGIDRPGGLDGSSVGGGIRIPIARLGLVPPVARVAGVDGQQRVDASAFSFVFGIATAAAGGVLLPVPNAERREGIGPGRLVCVPVGHDARSSEVVVGLAAPARLRPVEYRDNVLVFFIGQERGRYPQRRSWAGGGLVLAFVAGAAAAARQSPAGDDRLGTVLTAVAEATRRVTEVTDEGARLVAAVHLLS